MFRQMVKKKKEKKSKYQKLIDLLNEYEDPFISWYEEYVEEFGIFVLNNGEQGTAEEIIISKNYGFIKWLVENEKVEENSDLITLASELGCAFSSDVLLMYLAIQDNPIEFLVSILK